MTAAGKGASEGERDQEEGRETKQARVSGPPGLEKECQWNVWHLATPATSLGIPLSIKGGMGRGS